MANDTNALQANIAMIRAILPTVDDIDKPYYEQQLHEMSERLQKHREQARAFQPGYAPAVPSNGIRRPLSPPRALQSHSLKRNLELAGGPAYQQATKSRYHNTPPGVVVTIIASSGVKSCASI